MKKCATVQGLSVPFLPHPLLRLMLTIVNSVNLIHDVYRRDLRFDKQEMQCCMYMLQTMDLNAILDVVVWSVHSSSTGDKASTPSH